MSWHSRHFHASPRFPDTRPGGPSEVNLVDTKRPGDAKGARAASWTRRPQQTARPGKPGAR